MPNTNRRLAAVLRRGFQYRRALGWKRFILRIAKFWLWLPRLIHAPWIPANDARTFDSLPFGVNVLGYATSETGLGEVARQAGWALRTANVPFVINNLALTEVRNSEAAAVEVARDNPYFFNWVCVNVTDADFVAWQKGREYFRGRYNIGYWVWEMASVPPEMITSFSYYDEIWVPSTFVRDAIAPVSPVPVQTIPYAIIRGDGVAGELNRERLGIEPDDYVFLFVFHFFSLFERKNPLGLIEAFEMAFAGQSGVKLVIKSAGGESTPGASALRHAISRSANIIHLSHVMKREDVTALYDLCDCYVSLHRAEGFGLTIAEAMHAGKPVIATAYGGNVDFMSGDNSYPVNAEIVELKSNLGPYQQGWTWAEPDLNEASSIMRLVYENPDQARAKGLQAAQDVRLSLGVEHVGSLVSDRLRTIYRQSH